MQIRGPFSYSGNKFRIYNKHLRSIMSHYDKVHEPFCGSAVCLYNSNKGGIGIDIDNDVIMLHQALYDVDLIDKIEKAYREFFPDGKTEEGFYQLRNHFNSDWLKNGTTSENVHLLYLLMQLAFNSLMRFSSSGFNTPCGQSKKNWDSEKINKIKIHQTLVKEKEISFFRGVYSDLDLSLVDKDRHLIYLDPPYLASKFQYGGWNKENELELLSYLDKINNLGYKFILSNTFSHRGKTNEDLIEWSKSYDVNILDMTYNAWTAAVSTVQEAEGTVEVIIKNFDRSTKLF